MQTPSNSVQSGQKVPFQWYLLILLSLAGIALSFILTQHFYDLRAGAGSFKSFCNFSQGMNCDAVAASPYAELFAGIPLSSVTTGWYLALFFTYLLGWVADWRREATRFAVALTAIATVVGLIYFYFMAGVIGTYCLYCLTLDGINIVSLLLLLSTKPECPSKTPLNFGILKPLAGVLLGSVFVAVVALKGMDKLQGRASDYDMLAESVLSSAPIAVNAGPEYPTLGPADAKVTIVEFSDFQCPYCRLGAQTLHGVMARYPKQVKVVFRNYPLDPSCNPQMKHAGHPIACEAARVGYCSFKQGKFEPVYENIFEDQAKLVPGKPAEIAKDHSVDVAALTACTTQPETANAIQRDIEEGTRLGVQSTPTFFINGHKVEGVYPLPVWFKIIDKLVKQ